jgi:hypothetical protein
MALIRLQQKMLLILRLRKLIFQGQGDDIKDALATFRSKTPSIAIVDSASNLSYFVTDPTDPAFDRKITSITSTTTTTYPAT